MSSPSIESIQRITAECFDISFEDMRSPDRDRRVARPRQVAMYLCRNLTSRSMPEIGRQFRRDHTTVLHAVRRITALMGEDSVFAGEVMNTRARLVALKMPSAGFNVISLGEWLSLARKVNVPHIPAHFVAEAQVEDLRLAEVHDDVERSGRLLGFFQSVYAERDPGQIRRWDCCAPEGIKLAMSKGASTVVPPHVITVDEPRFNDILDELPPSQKTMPVWRRPWITPRIEAGFPVEYRVFVLNSTVIGISNYHPQRPLGMNETIRYEVNLARIYASAMIAAAPLPLLNPQIATAGLDPALFHGTFDFIATQKSVLFLEGGPPSLPDWGAHACCFDGREISGIALAPHGYVHPLSTPALTTSIANEDAP